MLNTQPKGRLPTLPATAWLENGQLRQLVLVITDVTTSEVMERWTFDIDTNQEVVAGG